MTENNPYAGFWKRLAAAFIDSIILSIFIQIIGIFITPIIMESIIKQVQNTATMSFWGSLTIYNILMQGLFILYFTLFESSSKQATLGKQLLKIKVVDCEGKRLSFLRALGRTFSKILSVFPSCVGFIMIGPSQKKQALHDKIVKTYVVNKDYKEGDALPLLAKHTGCMVSLAIVGGMVIVPFIISISLAIKSFGEIKNKQNIDFDEASKILYDFNTLSKAGSTYSVSKMGDYLFIVNKKDVSMMMVGHPELAFRIINNNQVCCESRTENACDIIQDIAICPAK